MQGSWSRRGMLGLLGAAAAMPGLGFAQEKFPGRRIEFIVPWAAGTAVDVVARVVGQDLEGDWGQAVTVDNRTGANSIIGSEYVARAKPDGYTVLLTGAPLLINPSLVANPTYDPIKDFTPVARMCLTQLILVVPSSSPFHTINDIVEYAKQNPRQVSYGTNGNGSTTHLSGALVGTLGGVELKHVPYKSGAQALTDTLSGQLSMSFMAIPTAAGLLKDGQLRAIGLSGKVRSRSLPDVPTLDESGLPGFEVVSWVGAFLPSGVAPEIAAQYSDKMREIAATPEFDARLLEQGLDPGFIGSEWAQTLPDEVKMWAELVAKSGAAA